MTIITKFIPNGIYCHTEDEQIKAYMYTNDMKAEDTEHKTHAKKFMPVWVFDKGYVKSPESEEVVERIIKFLNTIQI